MAYTMRMAARFAPPFFGEGWLSPGTEGGERSEPGDVHGRDRNPECRMSKGHLERSRDTCSNFSLEATSAAVPSVEEQYNIAVAREPRLGLLCVGNTT